MSTSTKILDHIVHLTPVGSLEETKKQWESLGFTVLAGGQHAGGITENALVVLSDLVYIELITFVHPLEYYIPGSPPYLARAGHQWANKLPGFVSYAFGGDTRAKPTISEILNERLTSTGSDYRYEGPKRGGRVRPDGKELVWELTTPSNWDKVIDGTGRPFYCADVTPRDLRVPTDKVHQTHTNKAKAIAFLRVLVSSEALQDRAKALEAIIGIAPRISAGDSVEWILEAPGLGQAPRFVLSAPKDDEEQAFVDKNGLGLFEVGFLVEENGGRDERKTPFGNISWVTATS